MNQEYIGLCRQPIMLPAPRAIENVSNYAELAAAFQNALPGATTQINVMADFPLSGILSVGNGRKIFLTSGGGGRYTLTRDVSGNLFTVEGMVDSALGVGNLIIDGNSNGFPNAEGALIRGESRSVILLASGAELRNNHSTSGGGGISSVGIVQISGGRIAGNQGTFGGGVGMSHGDMVMYDGVIENNEALYDGGGVYSASEQFLFLGGSILNNTAHQGGGGVCIDNGTFLMENGIIQSNICDGVSGGGGIIVSGSASSLRVLGGVIDNNVSVHGDGGGLQLNRALATLATFEIDGCTIISNNSAPVGNGGGIGINYERLFLLNVGASVVFSQNSASLGYQIAAADIPLYNSHIFTRYFTVPFVYGYDNYDIEYTHGTPLADGFMVNFDTMGGSTIPGQIIAEGTPALQPQTPVRGCDVFQGWYTDPMGTNAWDFASPVLSDMTLYAIWQPVACPSGHHCQPGCCGCRAGCGC